MRVMIQRLRLAYYSWRHDWYYYQMGEHVGPHGEWLSRPRRRVFWLWSFVGFAWEQLKCRASRAACLWWYKEHDWVDEGYASPDSGCIDMTCRRCGENHYVVLY